MTEMRALNGRTIMMQIEQAGNSKLAPESNVVFPAMSRANIQPIIV